MSNWNEPPTETIHLLSGEDIQHEVNGVSEDKRSAYAFVNGKEIKLYWFYDEDAVTMVNGEPTITGNGKWYEQVERQS